MKDETKKKERKKKNFNMNYKEASQLFSDL